MHPLKKGSLFRLCTYSFWCLRFCFFGVSKVCLFGTARWPFVATQVFLLNQRNFVFSSRRSQTNWTVALHVTKITFLLFILSTEKESIMYSENMWILLCFMIACRLLTREAESKFVISVRNIMNLPDRLLT